MSPSYAAVSQVPPINHSARRGNAPEPVIGGAKRLVSVVKPPVYPFAVGRESHRAYAKAHGALKERLQMAENAAATAKPKASKPITTKQLAYTLAEQHQLTKKQGQQMLGGPRRPDHQAPEEGRAGEDRRARHPASAQARRPHGPQSGDRRGHPDQGQQEGRLPRHQGTQDGDLIAVESLATKPRRDAGGVFVWARVKPWRGGNTAQKGLITYPSPRMQSGSAWLG